MSKFCGKCGTQLNKNGLCPKCDAAQIERMNEPKQTYAASDSSDVQLSTKKKKSGKKAVKVIAIVLVVVIVLGAAAGALSYFNVVDIPVVSSLVASVTGQTSGTSEKSFIINHDGSEYYISGACFVKLNDDGSITPVKCVDTDGDISGDETELTSENSRVLSLNSEQYIYDENTIYVGYGNNWYVKYTFIDDTTVEESVWISEETLRNSDIVKSLDYSCLSDFRLDGDYIYFLYDLDWWDFNSQKEIAYRLGRISKDGSSVEFIGNERASSYAVSDGWIYYYDNGYTYDESAVNGYYIDYERAGIYKMNVDGGEKKKLLDDMGEKNEEIYRDDLCKKLEVHGDYLYFLDCTDGNKDRVSRIKTNGSDIEHVSEEGVYCYALDTDSKEMYFIIGEYAHSAAESRNVYKVNLNDMTEEYVCEYGNYDCSEFDYYDGYLYFSDSSYYIGGTAGVRYNVNNGKREEMYGDYEFEHGLYLNWETVED